MAEDRPRRSLLGRLARGLLLVLGPAAVAIAGGYLYMTSGRYVTTENAYVKAQKITITPSVSGHVVDVSVGEHQVVEAGALLFRINPSRYEIAVASAQAELRGAQQRVEALRAQYRSRLAEMAEADDEIAFFQSEFGRVERLKSAGHVSGAAMETANRDLSMARSRRVAIDEQIAEILAQLSGDPDLPGAQHPQVMEAAAALERAQLDLIDTEVRAPTRAVVSNISLQVGEYVEEEEPVFSLVAADGFWVEANLKETDLTHLEPGQEAAFTVDAYPDHQWTATVESLAPATGAEFALLPPQNASGNWVKVVQRVPVRLTIHGAPDAPALRAGMSVSVRIDTKYDRPLPQIVNAARAWVRGSD
jgi:membrane fusion protein (multidrug efflux system)